MIILSVLSWFLAHATYMTYVFLLLFAFALVIMLIRGRGR